MKKYFALAAATLLAAAPSSAAVQIIENGILTGATGVDVGGTFYDVSFLDGTCAAVFSGCDSAADITFANAVSGGLAAQSLLDQVFLGVYDTSPALTRGCSSLVECYAFIPTSVASGSSQGSIAINVSGAATDSANGSFGASNAFDSTTIPQYTWARFTPSNATGAVPEPSTWAMMLLGFGAMGFALRRNRRKSGAMLAQAA